ncbi:hypothetical protein CBS101457_004251 [Exobasidium rhododendri]|nr:hypothetical protein CBS101457_004251 [Exobasidium rhododendri]
MVSFITDCVARATDGSNEQSVYIVEKRGGSGARNEPCGAAIIEDEHCPDYILESQEACKELTGVSNFLYLNVLVTHKGDALQMKGSGDALVEHVKLQAKGRGKKTVFVDCWSGNSGALTRYYVKHGFRPLCGFSKMSKHVEGVLWQGTLLSWTV